jgi:hypothetical protein
MAKEAKKKFTIWSELHSTIAETTLTFSFRAQFIHEAIMLDRSCFVSTNERLM